MNTSTPSKKLVDRLREAIRQRHYARTTEQIYIMWYKQFVRFHGLRHPDDMGDDEITAFLRHLSVNRNVAVATHRQALNALVFLFKHVLNKEIGMLKLWKPNRPKRMPVVLTVEEVRTLLARMTGTEALMARLLYGCGLRVSECIRLRVKDVDVEGGMLTVRGGKGDKDRLLELPERLRQALREQIAYAKSIWEEDRKRDAPAVETPKAFSIKSPNAGKQWPWFWVFPGDHESTDPMTRIVRRHHLHEDRLGRELADAARQLQMAKRVTAHTLRHSYATHLLQRGVNIRSIQERLGHSNVATTEVYTHVLKAMQGSVRSPLDDL